MEETEGSGPLLRGHIWLEGRPFALVTKGPIWSNKDRIEIVHADLPSPKRSSGFAQAGHLGTPGAMTRLDQQPITWERLQTPFGLTHLETGDPDLVQQLRFPGQRTDPASTTTTSATTTPPSAATPPPTPSASPAGM